MVFRRKKRSIPPYSRTKRLPKRRPRRNTGKTRNSHTEAANKASSRRQQQAKLRRQGFWAQLKRYTLLIMGGALTIYIVYSLFLSDSLTLHQIQVIEDGIAVTDHPIEELLNSLEGSNLLLLNTDEFEPYLQSHYPQYETLRISKNLPDTLLVTLESYPIIARLTVELTDGSEQQFFLTSAGRTSTYDEGLDSDALRTIIIESDQSLHAGADIIPQGRMAFILEAMQDFEDRFGMLILHALYLDIEREVHLWTERNFYVWLDITMDLEEQLTKLKKGLPRLNIYETDLEYIDLRISGINGEKIIYKPL